MLIPFTLVSVLAGLLLILSGKISNHALDNLIKKKNWISQTHESFCIKFYLQYNNYNNMDANFRKCTHRLSHQWISTCMEVSRVIDFWKNVCQCLFRKSTRLRILISVNITTFGVSLIRKWKCGIWRLEFSNWEKIVEPVDRFSIRGFMNLKRN